eukprot:RCo037403
MMHRCLGMCRSAKARLMSWVVRLENPRPQAWGYNFGPLLVFLAASMWAFDSIFRPYLSVRLKPEVEVCWEHLLGLFPLFPILNIFVVQKRHCLRPGACLAVLFLGVAADALANTILTQGYAFGHASLVGILQQSQPVFGLLGAYWFLKEDIFHRSLLPLAAVSLMGLLLMLVPTVTAAAQLEQGSDHRLLREL